MSHSSNIGVGIVVASMTASALLWVVSEFDARDVRHADKVSEEIKDVAATQKINKDRLSWIYWKLAEYTQIPNPDPDTLSRMEALRREAKEREAANERHSQELMQLRAEERMQ